MPKLGLLNIVLPKMGTTCTQIELVLNKILCIFIRWRLESICLRIETNNCTHVCAFMHPYATFLITLIVQCYLPVVKLVYLCSEVSWSVPTLVDIVVVLQ